MRTVLLLPLLSVCILGNKMFIYNANELVDLSKSVNEGTSHSGTTVFLDSDIDFTEELSQQFEPIGTENNNFRGAFDGNGHTISGLKISSNSQYTGLFGYSDGFTIKNVVLDGTCSITSTSKFSSFVGSIAGHCSFCTIKNAVNMGSVAFDGNTDSLYIGGVSAAISSATLQNCVNYGSVTHSGVSTGSYCELGGIAGYSFGDESSTKSNAYVQNCANYGTLAFNGTYSSSTIYLYMGGILGDSWSGSVTVENCVSAGRITAGGTNNNYIGSVVGYVNTDSSTTVTHCLWTSDVGHDSVYGYISSHASTASTDSSLTMLSSTTMTELNNYAKKNGEWSNWFTLNLNGGKINDLSQEALVVTQKRFPDSLKEGHNFREWLKGTEKYDPKTTNITEVTALTARYQVNNYTVTFHFWGFTYEYKNVTYGNAYGDPPEKQRTGYTFAGWFTGRDGGSKVEATTRMSTAEDHTLYARWIANKYVVAFDVNGGDHFSSQPSKEVTFDDQYGELPEPTRTGYTFSGWFTEKTGGAEVKLTTRMNNAKDHTLYACWTPNKYTVTFDDNKESTTEKETKEVTFDDYYGELPEPTRTGYTFAGWFTEKTGGAEVKLTTRMNNAKNHVLYAYWTANKYTVTFDENGGIFIGKETKEVTFDDYYGDLPIPTKFNSGLEGWFTDKNSDDKIEPITRVSIASNCTLYAHWASSATTIIFKGNGGISGQVTKVVYSNKYGDLPSAIRTGYTFNGWYTGVTGGTKVDSNTKISSGYTLYARWIINSYIVTLDANGGDELADSTKEITFNECYGDLPNATRTGYTFAGWFTDKAGGFAIESTTQMAVGNNHTLFARWTANKCTVTFDRNDGTTPESQKDVTYGNAYGSLPKLTRTGYVFVGWFTGAERGEEIVSTTEVKITENQTLYAHWTANNYIVRFDTNGGESLSEPTKEVTYDNAYGDLPRTTRIGYTFAGWFTEETGGTEITLTTKMTLANDHTLYAHWTANNYTVSFDGNGGTTTEQSRTVTYDSTYEKLPGAERAGYGLEGWFTETVKGVKIEQNTKVAITEDQVLYAHWKLGAITVTFDGAGGTSTQASKAVFYETAYGDLPDATRTGYTFVGWFTDYIKGIEVTKDTMVSIATHHTLYAHWSVNNYTVTFDANGGTTSMQSKEVTFRGRYGDLPEATRAGYTFAGWFTKIEGEQKIDSNSRVDIANDLILYAHWTANNYTVTFDANGGNPLSESESTKEVTYDSTYGDLPKPTRTGYKFEGWFTEKEGGDKIEPITEVNITESQTLHAHWKAGGIVVTFNATGGASSQPVKEVFFEDKYGELPSASKTGYTFVGWFTDITEGEEVTSETVVEATENQTLYAHWDVNSYTVTFDGNGGKPSLETERVTFDEAYGDLPEAERTGYTFAGWFTEIEGGDEIENDTVVGIGKDHILYAHWTANSYTVIFGTNGGESLSETSRNVAFDETYGDLPKPTRTGYTFAGWFTEEFGGTEVTSTTKMTVANDHTIYAHWTANTYTVSFDGNGGKSPQTAMDVTYGTLYGELPGAKRTGYTFEGWFTETERGEEIEPITEVNITENKTLYAHWTANKYVVTFNATGGTSNQSSKEVTFDGTYGVLPDAERADYAFVGWFNEPAGGKYINADTRVDKAENHTLYARWKEGASSTGSLSITLIVAIPTSVILITAIVLIILGLLLKKRKDKEEMYDNERGYELSQPLISEDDYSNEYSRVILTSNDEAERNDGLTGIDAGILSKLYTQDYVRPTLRDALLQVDLTDRLADLIYSACENAARVVKDEGRLFDGFTEEDAAAVAMYTYDFGFRDFENNPYRIVNRSLAGRNYANLQKASGLLYLVMTALRKLPRYTGCTLYRGVRGEVSLDEEHYHEGNVITWTALSSTSPDMGATKAFLARGSKSRSAKGTLFVIDGGWGYNIQPYSLFPGEVEILLEPERQFRVKSVFPGEELTFINLQMLDTPLALPHVFGEGRDD